MRLAGLGVPTDENDPALGEAGQRDQRCSCRHARDVWVESVENTIPQTSLEGDDATLDDYNRRVSETPPSGARADADAGSAQSGRRPAAVTILAILQLLSAAGYGLIVAVLLMDGAAVVDQLAGNAGADGGPIRDLEVMTVTALVGVFCVASLAAGLLLLRMRQLGWTITMLLTGLGLASSIYFWWAQGTTVAIWVIVQVVTVFYLNQRQVRVAFGISRRRAGDALDEARG